MTHPRWAAAALLALALTAPRGDAAPLDPTARGVDVFVHAPAVAASASSVEVDVEAFGFPTALSIVPLDGAEIEAAWDPQKLGEGVTAAPLPVRAKTDAAGRARLVVPVPRGGERALSLLVAVRARGHDRVRAVAVQRAVELRATAHVVDRRVVPGSVVPAWAIVTDATTGAPAKNEPIEVALLEGGKAREVVRAVTDAAGTALVRVPIPRVDSSAIRWSLRVRTRGEGTTAEGAVDLAPRDETPGTPRLTAAFGGAAYLAGARATWRVLARDATDQPIAGAPVRVWIGPKGTQPPKDDAGWARLPLRRTDATGAVEGDLDTPRTVVRGVGTTLDLVAKAEVEGEALDARATAQVGVGVATAALELEAGALVAGASQRGLLRVHDAHDRPVSTRLRVRGDGLAADVTTDADGEAELTWSPPRDVGARRELGPCAGSVSASVRVERVDASAAPDLPATIELCVPVNREADGLLVVDRPLVRVGDRVHVTARLRDGAEPPGPWSIVLGSDARGRATSRWIDAGELSADVEVPAGPPGRWTLTAAFPSNTHGARVLSRSVLVAPRALPRLTARATGRAAPGGFVDVDADLADDAGAPLTGTVAAVLVDARGGGHTGPIEAFDTRAALCAAAGVFPLRCDAFLSQGAAGDPLRRAAIGQEPGTASRPALDPGGTAQAEMTKTFAAVMKSLEGGVFEASASRERLADVGRKGAGGWAFNPEILSLATAALDEPPLTPGGEPVTLDDLIAIDHDVTFDHVARRVTRLKIFRVLAAVRTWRRESNLEPDEPIFKDPNALLRRLVREGKLTQDQLVDPWGGEIAFVPAARPPTPFLSVVRGFELHAAGPDGRVGTGDDVSDPFERVLRSGTPYAKALHEDALVDAKLDAEVADATVSSWQRTLEENTGTSLGNIGHGWGEGTGEGFGAGGLGAVGHGSGHGRLSQGMSLGGATWAPPVRTDARGHARLRLQLGDAETTWRIALVAFPDASTPATTVVDVASFLPASVRVEAGARWVEGDAADVALVVRNRGDHPRTLQIVAKASGAAAASGGPVAVTVTVPARGVARAVSHLRATAVGKASLSVDLLDGGAVVDHVDHTFDVEAAAEALDLTDARWIAGEVELAASFEPGMRLRGAPRVVIERGVETALDEAIASLEPGASATPDALADALEVAARVKEYAVHVGGAGSSLAAHAATLADHAEGRLAALRDGGAEVGFAAKARAAAASGDAKEAARPTPCPPDLAALADRVRALDVEPAPRGGAALACWDAFVSTTVTRVESSSDAVALAAAVSALAARPHRAITAGALADQLRELVKLRPSGAVALESPALRSRAARAAVFAALVRAAALGKSREVAPLAKLEGWLRVQEDADGSYGSAAATRAAVLALLSIDDAASAAAEVSSVRIGSGDAARTFELRGPARVVVPLNADATKVEIEVRGAPVLARLERPALRPWTRTPSSEGSPLRVEVDWPANARAGESAIVHVALKQALDRPLVVEARVPLPPGASIAAKVDGVSQVRGALTVRLSVEPSSVARSVDVPVRFALAGAFTAPEATARAAFEEVPRAVAASRPVIVR